MKRNLLTGALCLSMVGVPMQSILSEEPPPPDQPFWGALCVMAVAGIAATAVYIVSKKCQPKYYWLMDDDTPPKFWVASATRKECQINGWQRIGGPYERVTDAPAVHPASTNRVEFVASQPMTIKVQSSTNLTHWTTVYQEVADLEDFGYWPTNAAMFRLEVSP